MKRAGTRGERRKTVMAMTDPIADMLTRIEMPTQPDTLRLEIPASKMKKSIAEILKNEGSSRTFQ